MITTSVDLYHGATATAAHAVAAIYIGVSIAFGKGVISDFIWPKKAKG